MVMISLRFNKLSLGRGLLSPGHVAPGSTFITGGGVRALGPHNPGLPVQWVPRGHHSPSRPEAASALQEPGPSWARGGFVCPDSGDLGPASHVTRAHGSAREGGFSLRMRTLGKFRLWEAEGLQMWQRHPAWTRPGTLTLPEPWGRASPSAFAGRTPGLGREAAPVHRPGPSVD